MKITRIWAMPNKNTFSIKPISLLINRYLDSTKRWIDPFVNDSIFKSSCYKTNDLNPVIKANYHLKALEFLKIFPTNSIDGVLFDPPYSPRQIKECYDGIGIQVHQDSKINFYTNIKKEITRTLKPNGLVISCCWNSTGIGKKNGFQIIEILLTCHGGWHNDTIVTVERKVQTTLM